MGGQNFPTPLCSRQSGEHPNLCSLRLKVLWLTASQPCSIVDVEVLAPATVGRAGGAWKNRVGGVNPHFDKNCMCLCFSSSLCITPARRRAGTPPSMLTMSRGSWHSEYCTNYFLELIPRVEQLQEGDRQAEF